MLDETQYYCFPGARPGLPLDGRAAGSWVPAFPAELVLLGLIPWAGSGQKAYGTAAAHGFIYQEPRTPVGHVHRSACSGNRSAGTNIFKQFDFAMSDVPLRIQIDAKAQGWTQRRGRFPHAMVISAAARPMAMGCEAVSTSRSERERLHAMLDSLRA